MGKPLFAVLLPAAGSGSRFNAGRGEGAGPLADKLLNDIGGGTVLQRAVGLFARRGDVSRVLIVTSPERFEGYREHLRATIDAEKLAFAGGGRERWESVLLGLRVLAGEGERPQFVAVHDAARPLTPAAVIEEAFATAAARGAALPCVAEPATLKRRGVDGTVRETVSRANLYQAQTPQCFDFAKLLTGYEQLLAAGQVADATDDAQIFERAGHAVPITTGSALNLKITTAEDLQLARALARL